MTPLLQIKDISLTLGGKQILDSVSFDLHKGELKVLIGPSGGGKSTLLQCLNFLHTPNAGTIALAGTPVHDKNRQELNLYRQQVGMIFQDFNLFDHLNALDNVSIALRKVKKIPKKEAKERAFAELERVGLQNKGDLFPAELSGGQKQRVSIARALAMDPKVILLDEPTSALDPELVGEVLAVIRELARGGMTMLMATHQMSFTRNLADEVLFMQKGRLIEQGTPANLLAPGSGTRTADFCSTLHE